MAANNGKNPPAKQRVLGSIIFICACFITYFFFTVGTSQTEEHVIVEDLSAKITPLPSPEIKNVTTVEQIHPDLTDVIAEDSQPSPSPYPIEPEISEEPTPPKPVQDPAMIASELEAPTFPSGATVIGMLVPIVSRGYTELEDFPFFDYLLPSTLRTANWTFGEFFIEFYLGYDTDDLLFDNSHTLALIEEKFESAVDNFFASLNAVSADRPHMQLIKVKYPGGYQQAPIWVLNVLAQKAYSDGCDYLFHLSDDVELKTPHWPGLLTAILESNEFVKYFGITGPWDPQNHRIISQAFVHRIHMEIFGELFPWAFKTWYADDWISVVYGINNFFQTEDVQMVNNLKTRYTVNSQDRRELVPEIDLAKKRIHEWLQKHHSSQVTQWSTEWRSPIDE